MKVWELVRQFASNVLSLRAASIAINRLSQGSNPQHRFVFILFRAADLGSRMLMFVLAALVMRPPGARLHDAHQSAFFFACLMSAGVTLIAVHAVNKKQPKTVFLKSALCCFFLHALLERSRGLLPLSTTPTSRFDSAPPLFGGNPCEHRSLVAVG